MERTKAYKSLQKECDKQNLHVSFEFTAPGTPQQNSVVERRIPALMGRARAMLIQAGIDSKGKENFGVKAFLQQRIWIT